MKFVYSLKAILFRSLIKYMFHKIVLYTSEYEWLSKFLMLWFNKLSTKSCWCPVLVNVSSIHYIWRPPRGKGIPSPASLRVQVYKNTGTGDHVSKSAEYVITLSAKPVAKAINYYLVATYCSQITFTGIPTFRIVYQIDPIFQKGISRRKPLSRNYL